MEVVATMQKELLIKIGIQLGCASGVVLVQPEP